MERFFLYDDVEDTKTRFVSFAGQKLRYDLAILQSSRFFGKVLVMDIQFGRFAIIADDVEEPGYLEHVYNRSEEETVELREYLRELLN
ncbi:Cytosolic protein OS=Lysinibacillus sphaericus OX=1421 GN=LS41612_05265 PE=4 SV=1 [Lysinibacillus sphaericus]